MTTTEGAVMVGSRVIAALLLTTALAGCGNVPQKTAAQAPVAAAPPAVPAPPGVTTPPIVIVPPFVTVAPPTTDEPKVHTDQYSSSVEIDGVLALAKPSDGIERRWFIHSDIDKKTLSLRYRLYIRVNYDDYRRYNYFDVTDENAKHIYASISHSTNRCSVNKCDHWEYLDVYLDENVLRQRQTTGFVLKIWANNGKDLFLQVSPQQIQKQFAQVAAVQQALKDGKL